MYIPEGKVGTSTYMYVCRYVCARGKYLPKLHVVFRYSKTVMGALQVQVTNYVLASQRI